MFKFNQTFRVLQCKFIYAWLNGYSKHDALKIVPLRAFHANFTWQNMSASLKRTAPSNTVFFSLRDLTYKLRGLAFKSLFKTTNTYVFLSFSCKRLDSTIFNYGMSAL